MSKGFERTDKNLQTKKTSKGLASKDKGASFEEDKNGLGTTRIDLEETTPCESDDYYRDDWEDQFEFIEV